MAACAPRQSHLSESIKSHKSIYNHGTNINPNTYNQPHKRFDRTFTSDKNIESEILLGELREIFISNVIKNILPSNFEIGSGSIVNQRGDQSPSQHDVVIYDKSFLPPFIKEYNLGIYPAESVLAIIEVKSRLGKTELKELNKKSIKTYNDVYIEKGSIYPEFKFHRPFFTVFGFYGTAHYTDRKKEKLREWIWNNCKNLHGICLLNGFSWFNLGRKKGKNHLKIKDNNNEETKSFFGILLDNIVTMAKKRDIMISRGWKHRDYFSIYLRDQSGIRKKFEALSKNQK